MPTATDEPYPFDESWDTSEDLVVCPECGSEIYGDTDHCPQCGHWMTRDERRRVMVWSPRHGRAMKLVAFLLLLVILGFILLAVLLVVTGAVP
ncbi:MAG: hypothetical protein CMJ18_12770 [Phycisphaeraceae bacterium]|nr:hypothetical protein [Phycisphaeraceae bacterium]